MPRVFLLLLTALLLAGGCATPFDSTSLNDSTLTARVRAALLDQPDTSTAQIEVDTIRGIVTLSGIVDSAVIEGRALTVARGVDGVREVRSRLRIDR